MCTKKSIGPPYLSPSSIKQFEENEEEFFLRYMVRVPRQPQSQPMAIGSAFDACIKAYLTSWNEGYNKIKHTELYGEYFEQSVESHNRDWAYDRGIIVFNMYRETGVLTNLLLDVEPGSLQPLESVEKVVDGIPLLGKPDLVWISKTYGCKIVDDWKCNGACSPHNKSPTPGYMDIFPSRNIHNACHLVDGVNVLDIHPDYELQLVIYSFLTGAEIVGINQLVFGKSEPGIIGQCRVALHRHKISAALKLQVKTRMKLVWGVIINYEEGRAFSSISAKRCAQLTKQGEALSDPTIRMLSGRS